MPAVQNPARDRAVRDVIFSCALGVVIVALNDVMFSISILLLFVTAIKLYDRIRSQERSSTKKKQLESAEALRRRLHEATRQCNFQDVDEILKEMTEKGAQLSAECYFDLISSYCKKGAVVNAEEWLTKVMRAGPGMPRTACLEVFVGACAKSGAVDRMDKWLNKLPKFGLQLSLGVYETVLLAYAEIGLIGKAAARLEYMRASGVRPTADIYRIVLQACVRKNQDWTQALEEAMRVDGVAPDAAWNRKAIEVCCAANNPDAAVLYLDRLVADSMPSMKNFQDVIMAYAKQGKMDEMDWWLRKMQHAGFDGDVTLYTKVLETFLQADYPEAVRSWFQRMQAAGVEPNHATLHLVLESFALEQDVVGAEAAMQRIIAFEGRTCHPRPSDYCTIIFLCLRAGEYERALYWHRWAEGQNRGGKKSHVEGYAHLVHEFAKVGNSSSLLATYRLLRESGSRISDHHGRHVIDVFARCGDVAGAEEWLQLMQEDGCKPYYPHYCALVQACARAGNLRRAEHWMEYIPQAETSQCFILNVFAAAGEPDKAELSLMRLQSAGQDLSTACCNCVIDACVIAGQLPRAEEWLTKMGKNGPVPDYFSYGAIIYGFMLAQQLDRATYWSEEMQSKEVVHEESSFLLALTGAGLTDKASRYLRLTVQMGYWDGTALRCAQDVLKSLERAGQFKELECLRSLLIERQLLKTGFPLHDGATARNEEQISSDVFDTKTRFPSRMDAF